MKELIKTLDDLRPEDIRFPFDPLNKKLCFGGGGGGGGPALPKVKIKVPELPSASDIISGLSTTLGDAGSALQTNLDSATSGINTTLSDASSALATNIDTGLSTVKEGLDSTIGQIPGLMQGKKDDDGGGEGPGSASTPGESESVGSGSSKIAMKEATASKGKKAKMGAKGKRALRKVGATV